MRYVPFWFCLLIINILSHHSFICCHFSSCLLFHCSLFCFCFFIYHLHIYFRSCSYLICCTSVYVLIPSILVFFFVCTFTLFPFAVILMVIVLGAVPSIGHGGEGFDCGRRERDQPRSLRLFAGVGNVIDRPKYFVKCSLRVPVICEPLIPTPHLCTDHWISIETKRSDQQSLHSPPRNVPSFHVNCQTPESRVWKSTAPWTRIKPCCSTRTVEKCLKISKDVSRSDVDKQDLTSSASPVRCSLSLVVTGAQSSSPFVSFALAVFWSAGACKLSVNWRTMSSNPRWVCLLIAVLAWVWCYDSHARHLAQPSERILPQISLVLDKYPASGSISGGISIRLWIFVSCSWLEGKNMESAS